MSLRSRIAQAVSAIKQYARKQRTHAYSLRENDSENSVWLEAEAKGQESAADDIQEVLDKTDPAHDCKEDTPA